MVHAQPQQPRENEPSFIRDAIVSLAIIVAAAPTILFCLAARRLGSGQEIPLGEDVRRSFIRR